MIDTTTARARSFDAWAEDYDRYRPGYPARLFDTIARHLDFGDRPDVVDLGAGTGKAAVPMAHRGWRVTAVDPGVAMLSVLCRRAEAKSVEIHTALATAEETGLPPASADLATAGEAYHWFDAPRALAEMARIVRPRGGIACFWNVPDGDASTLVAEYEALGNMVTIERRELRRPGPREETRRAIRDAGSFEEPVFEQIRHVVQLTAAELVGLAFTKSHVRMATPDVQEAFRHQLEELIARHGASLGDTVSMGYVTDCWIARRKAR